MDDSPPIIILGAGAFAREVHDWCIQSGRRVVGFFVTVASGVKSLRALPVFEKAAQIPPGSVYIAGVGSPALLQHLASACGVPPATAVVHPSVTLGSTCRIGAGSIVCPGAILTCDVTLGGTVVVNLGVTIGHDCRVGRWSVLHPRVALSGGCILGDGVTMGTGAITTPKVAIPAWSIIGAGAVVTETLETEGVYVGTPARRRRDLAATEQGVRNA